MKKTLVVNMLGGPGVGKSTAMSALFAKLKADGIDCEFVSEFAKGLVWEKRDETFKDEIYIFAKQNHCLFRVAGKVDVIVTDRPLILTCFYGQANKELSALCLSEFNKYDNLNYLITRDKEYNPNGRNQTAEEAVAVDAEFKKILDQLGIEYTALPGNNQSIEWIYQDVLNALKKRKG